MASPRTSLIFCSFLLLISSSYALIASKPKALVLAVSKDAKTLQHTVQISQRTPLVPIKQLVDLGGRFLWVDCEKGYVSSSFKPVPCDSAECKLSGSGACTTACFSPPRPGCFNNTCSHMPENPVTRVSTGGDFGQDVISIQTTNGWNPGPVVSSSKLMLICGATFLLEGLASGVKGVLGLGTNKVSLPSQVPKLFNIDRKFAICLSSSSKSNGVIIFGGPPYGFKNFDMISFILYTPLLKNPVSTVTSFEGEPSAEYFVNLTSIVVGSDTLKINKTLLTINKEGQGGTKFSTVTPYTVLETSIYKAFVKAFLKNNGKFTRVPAVKPFEICYDAKSVPSMGAIGPSAPFIDLVFHSEFIAWRIYGGNSMVKVGNDKLCLGFVDGGLEPTTSIVIGAHQMEDNLFQFDIANKQVGFTGTLQQRQISCSHFNFTSTAQSLHQPL